MKAFTVEAFQSITLKDPEGVVYATLKIWRNKGMSLGPFELDEQAVWDVIEKYHPIAKKEIVKALIELRGVTRIEWTGRDGCGFVVTVE